MATSPVYFGAVKQAAQTIANADGTTLKTLASAGTNGSKLFSPVLTSNDSASKVVDLWLYNGALSFLLGNASVPNGSGLGGVWSVSAFASVPGLPVDNDGNKFVYLPNGWNLQIAVEAAMTIGKTLYATASQEDF